MSHPYFRLGTVIGLALGLVFRNAQTVELVSLVGVKTAAELQSNGRLTRASFSKPQLRLMPEIANDLSYRLWEAGPNFLVESLYLYPKPSAADVAWQAEQQLALFNGLCALSSLEGIQYFSATRQAFRTFYEQSYVVVDDRAEAAIADPVFTELPASATIYAVQKDLTFGRNRYRYDFNANTDSLAFVQENLTTMFYGIFPIFGAGKLRSGVLIIDAGPYILIYVAAGGNSFLIPGLEGKLRDSFSNRADAIYNWFIVKANRIF